MRKTDGWVKETLWSRRRKLILPVPPLPLSSKWFCLFRDFSRDQRNHEACVYCWQQHGLLVEKMVNIYFQRINSLTGRMRDSETIFLVFCLTIFARENARENRRHSDNITTVWILKKFDFVWSPMFTTNQMECVPNNNKYK